MAASFSDGFASAFSFDDSDKLKEIHRWKETRLSDGHRYISLEISEQGIFSCTSSGALRLTALKNDQGPTSRLSALPTRLNTWRMSSDHETFSYGGDEVEVSVWDTQQAFLARPTSAETNNKKRKRDTLFPGEIWRAKNVQSDHLGLRQPLCITSLTYLAPFSNPYHLAAGTELGNVRRYDTRAARRPVSDWKVAKMGGVRTVEKGFSQHELFVSDHGHNLLALDLRNGNVIYSYEGLAGAVTSLAPSPSFLASVARDRYVRIHSTFSPPQETGHQQERKGEVLEKLFMKSTPTVIAWDQSEDRVVASPHDAGDEDVWEAMEAVGGDSEDDSGSKKKR